MKLYGHKQKIWLAFNASDAYGLLVFQKDYEKGSKNFIALHRKISQRTIDDTSINAKSQELFKHYEHHAEHVERMFEKKLLTLDLGKALDDQVKDITDLVDDYGAVLLDIIYFAEVIHPEEVELIIGNAEQAENISLNLIKIALEVAESNDLNRVNTALRDFNFVLKDSVSWFERSADLLRRYERPELAENVYSVINELRATLNTEPNLITLKREAIEASRASSQEHATAVNALNASIITLDSLLGSADSQFNELQNTLAGNLQYGYRNIFITLIILIALGALHFRTMLLAIRKIFGDLAALNRTGRLLTTVSDRTEATRLMIQSICRQKGFAQGMVLFDLEGKNWASEVYFSLEELVTKDQFLNNQAFSEQRNFVKKSAIPRFLDQMSGSTQPTIGEGLSLLTQPLMDEGQLVGVLQLLGEANKVSLVDGDHDFFSSAAGTLTATLKNIHMRDIIKEHNRSLEHVMGQRTAALRQKSDDMASMLSNLHQGLFTITEEGLIHPEYAPFLEEIFETQDIAARHFSALLFSRCKLSEDKIQELSRTVELSLGQQVNCIDQYASSLIDDLVIYFEDGRSKHLSLNWTPIIDEHQCVSRLLVSVRDISDYKKAEEQENLLAAIFKTSLEPIAIFDKALTIKAVNNAFIDKLNIPEESIIGANLESLFVTTHDQPFFRKIKGELTESNNWDGEVHFDLQGRENRICWLTISPINDEDNTKHPNYLGTFSDIRQREKVENELRYLANYDALTNLPNRRLFSDRLEYSVAAAKRQKNQLALLFIDLNRFKFINDSFGHEVGDNLLKVVAERLRACLREPDELCRLGGDEFTVLIENTKTKQNILTVINKILAQFENPFVVAQKELRVGVSIGVSVFPEHGNEAKDLMINADVAMYSAKRKNLGYQFFETHMNIRASENLELENDLHNSLLNDELFLVYQPKIDLKTEQMIGAEVLLRWQHPKIGLVPPGRFIALAEETGLIIPIGQWVLKTACQKIAEWRENGLPPISLAVNVSAKQFQTIDFTKDVKQAITDNALDPSLLELELTESLLMDMEKSSIKTMSVLKEMGLKLSIDDFGIGYSSLQYLSNFPIDYLKIDRSFVMELNEGEKGLTIVRAIIAMAQGLNLKVIAEGVEKASQVKRLRDFGCHIAQGYYYSRPMEESDFLNKLSAITVESEELVSDN